MREILFRGFHPCDGPETIVVGGQKVRGRWVEGYIVKHPSAIQIGNDYSPWYIHVPPVDPDDDGGVFNVLPSTVGQYTGLTDKNGKRIFEMDRIKWDEDEWGGPNIEEVKWDYDLISSRKSDWEEFCEVIGTAFDKETCTMECPICGNRFDVLLKERDNPTIPGQSYTLEEIIDG